MKMMGKVILSLVVFFIVSIVGIGLALFTAISGSTYTWLYEIVIAITASSLIIAPIIRIWSRSLFSNLWRYSLIVLLVIGVLIALAKYLDYKDKQMSHIIGTEVNLYEYKPFSASTKTVSLSSSATLSLSTDLPRLDGATALYPLYSAFVQAVYPKKDYGFSSSEVICTKTVTAYENLTSGKVDMIFVASPSQQQLQKAAAAGKKLKLTPIGYEAFVFFVNSRNPVKGLTSGQIKSIYAGEITNWKALGGGNVPIKAFQRPENSGSQTRLIQLMGDKPLMTPPRENVEELMGGIIARTADYKNYDNAIGYSFLYYLTGMVGNDKVKLLAIDGIFPNAGSIKDGTYPFNTTIYAITAGSTNPNVSKFIDWIISPQGQELVKKTGYIPLL